MPTDVQQARVNMVENQVRTWDVVDTRVLDALTDVRRSDFVAPAWRALAYADMPLPLAHGEVMMKPVVEGRMLQALHLAATEDVLEIGTGSGFIAACLGRLAHKVYSVEQHADLAAEATQRLHKASIENAQVVVAEAVHAYAPGRTFDAVVVTGAVADIPSRWLGWLKPGGRLFAVCGESPAMHALLLRQCGDGRFSEENLFDTDLPYLAHAEPVAQFVL